MTQSSNSKFTTGTRSLRIAWLGPVPNEHGGVGGVASDLLDGLASLGHRIDCFMAGNESKLPDTLEENPNITFVWASTRWEWNRWYSRTHLGAFITDLIARAWAFVRMRGEILQHHGHEPYDLIYQFSNIETVGVPKRLVRKIPLVIHPETHIAGELRWFRAERHLARQCEPRHRRLLVGCVLIIRSMIQRRCIRAAELVICISSVFRNHIVTDYGVYRTRTRVIPNPVRLSRFDGVGQSLGEPPIILVLGRISVRKGIDQIVELSHVLAERGVDAMIRIVGSHSLQSDYRQLLVRLNPANARYVGPVAAEGIPDELARADVLVQASKYEPFGLTVGEALAAGVPVVATTEVGAIEGVSNAASAVVPVGDVERLADAVEDLLTRLRLDEASTRDAARFDAERLFAPRDICETISDELQEIVGAREVAECDCAPATVAATG